MYKKNSGGGGGGVEIFFFFRRIILSHFTFYAIVNISRKNNSGNKKQNIFLFRKTIVPRDRDNGNLYPIYIEKQQLWC